MTGNCLISTTESYALCEERTTNTLGDALLALRTDLGGVDLTDPARLQAAVDWRCVTGDDDGHLRLCVRR